MKLQAILLTFLTFLVVAPIAVIAQTPETNVDSRCTAYLLTKPFEADGNPKCNIVCEARCIGLGQSCAYQRPSNCITLTNEIINNGLTGFNIFGVDFGPTPQAIPRIIRLALTAVFSIIGLIAILLGVYAMYLRSTAGDNAEKVELTAKVIRNAIIGIVISFLGVVIVQIVALLLGLTGGLFNFNFIPTATVILDASTALQPCETGALGYIINGNTAVLYNCQASVWVRQAGNIPINVN
jgi:hypothetical protein